MKIKLPHRGKRPHKGKTARGYFVLNLPGQDEKAGRRLIARPLRYRMVIARLNALRLDAGALQESTIQARDCFRRRPRWECYSGTTNEKNGVGNAVVWRTDRLQAIDQGMVRLHWSGATKDNLYLPWVKFKPRGGGEPFVMLAGHLPYVGYRGASIGTRGYMSTVVAAFLRGQDNWIAGFDWNSTTIGTTTAKAGRGRTVSQHHVDSLIASHTFEPKRARVFLKNVMWAFSDHGLVTIRGRWS